MNAVPKIPSAAAKQSFPIEGMTCASCVRRVEVAITKVPGVTAAAVNLATESADITFSGAIDSDEIIAAIRGAGYDVPVEKIEVDIEGMTCASCVNRVEKAIAAVLPRSTLPPNARPLSCSRVPRHAPRSTQLSARPAMSRVARRRRRLRREPTVARTPANANSSTSSALLVSPLC